MKKQLLLGLVLLSGMSALSAWKAQVWNPKENKWMNALLKNNPKFKTKTVYHSGITHKAASGKGSSSICASVCKKTKGYPYALSWFPAGGWKYQKNKWMNSHNGKPSGCVCSSALEDYIVVKYLK